MRTKMIYSNDEFNSGYGAGSGNTERYEYECPCRKGKIVEEHDNTPGFREHNVYINCDKCNHAYELNTSKGVRYWELVPKKKDV